MSYNEKQPFSVFINKFNEITNKFNNFDKDYQQTIDTVKFIEEQIVPRYSGRPTIFKNIRAMQDCNALIENDVCIVFKESAPNVGESYVDVYKVKNIKELVNQDYIKLYNQELGALQLTVGISSESISKPFIDGLFSDNPSTETPETETNTITNIDIDNVVLGNIPTSNSSNDNTLISNDDIETLVD